MEAYLLILLNILDGLTVQLEYDEHNYFVVYDVDQYKVKTIYQSVVVCAW